MRRAAAAALCFALSGGSALGQAYPNARGARAADPALLLRAREVHERFARGFAAEERGDWPAAAEQFRRVVALDPPEPQGSTARYDLALAEAHEGRTESAVTLLEAALHRDPHFAAAAANLVALYLQRGEVPKARAAAERFLAIAPSARAQYDRGLTALAAGDLAAARAAFRALSDANPGYAVAHYDLALTELRAGRDDAARAELDRALALAPEYARARFALATLLLRAGRKDDARAAFDRCAHDAADPALRALAADLRDRITR